MLPKPKLIKLKELNMEFNIGDIVKHNQKGIGTVQLIDGVAVWVRWAGGDLNHTSSFALEILDKTACA